VITDLDMGGAERALTSLVVRLNQARWRPSVFCLGRPGPLAEVVRQAGIPCECLGVSRWNPVQLLIRLTRSLRRFRPELVQSFLFHANLAARLSAPWARCSWVVGGIRVAEHQKRWHLTLDRLTAWLTTGSVCVSQGVMDFSREVARLDPDRLMVIPNGIDPGPFDAAMPALRTTLGVPEDAHLALYVGRLDPQKGLPDLLDAAERVIRERCDWHLVLAGDGPSRDWLARQLSDRAGLRENVHWLGQRDDIPSLLKSADVLVQASLWEGMPNVVLEAMAARRPVIGTAVEGTEDLVVAGRTGWLVPPHDVIALHHALVEAAESPQQCHRYGEAGRLRVEQEFSLDATVAAYEELWAGILGLKLPGLEAGGIGS